MKRILILLILIIAAGEVFAQAPQRTTVPVNRRKPVLTNDDEYTAISYDMYAPRAGANYLNVAISVLSSDYTIAGSTSTVKGSGYGINLNYSHGLTSYLAYYLSQDIYGYKYDFSANNGTSEVEALGPTIIGLKGIRTYLGSFFYYSAAYQSAILEKRDDSGGLNIFQENDRRNNIELSGGFGALLGGFSLGGQYSYYMYQDTDVVYSNVATKYKSGVGSKWKLFAQYENHYKIGAAYGEQTIDAANTTTNGVVTLNGYGKYEYSRIQLYTIYPLSITTDLFVDITKTARRNDTFYSKYDDYLGTVMFRISF